MNAHAWVRVGSTWIVLQLLVQADRVGLEVEVVAPVAHRGGAAEAEHRSRKVLIAQHCHIALRQVGQ